MDWIFFGTKIVGKIRIFNWKSKPKY